jgi:hypothetical protein
MAQDPLQAEINVRKEKSGEKIKRERKLEI